MEKENKQPLSLEELTTVLNEGKSVTLTLLPRAVEEGVIPQDALGSIRVRGDVHSTDNAVRTEFYMFDPVSNEDDNTSIKITATYSSFSSKSYQLNWVCYKDE